MIAPGDILLLKHDHPADSRGFVNILILSLTVSLCMFIIVIVLFHRHRHDLINQLLVGLGVVLEPGVAKNSTLLLKIWLELVLDNQVSCRLITAIILGCRTHILNIRVILVGVSRASIGEVDKLMLWLVLRV